MMLLMELQEMFIQSSRISENCTLITSNSLIDFSIICFCVIQILNLNATQLYQP